MFLNALLTLCISAFKVGDLSESNVYISKKVKSAGEIGINANHVKLSKSATQSQVICLRCFNCKLIHQYNINRLKCHFLEEKTVI